MVSEPLHWTLWRRWDAGPKRREAREVATPAGGVLSLRSPQEEKLWTGKTKSACVWFLLASLTKSVTVRSTLFDFNLEELFETAERGSGDQEKNPYESFFFPFKC